MPRGTTAADIARTKLDRTQENKIEILSLDSLTSLPHKRPSFDVEQHPNQTVISTVGELMATFGKILNCVKTGRTFTLDGELIDMLDFIKDNEDISLDELNEIEALRPGDTMPLVPTFILRRET